MKEGKYPEPDISADEAWDKMKKMMGSLPKETINDKPSKSFRKKILSYGGVGLLVLSVIVYYLSANKPHKLPAAIVYLSKGNPEKEILSNGVVAFLDRQSSISEETTQEKETIIAIKGAAYFQGIPKNKSTLLLKVGTINVLPLNTTIYTSFDTSTGISSFHVQYGSALLEADGTKLTLTASESIEFNEKTRHWSDKHRININLFGYATRIFDFTETSLKEAAECIGKAYNVKIQFEKKGLFNCRITTRFDNKSLKEVLDIMAYTLNFEYTLDEKNSLVLLTGEGCD